MADRIPPELWGRDHWSTFAYIGHNTGKPVDRDKMRPKARSPRASWAQAVCMGGPYPTRLADGSEVHDHDDYDCADDIVAAGLLEAIGTGATPAYSLTPRGAVAWARPRRPHRARVRAGVRWRRGGRARWRVGGGVSLRVLVTGGRDFGDRWRVFDVLDAIHRGPFGPIRVLVSGHARGADTLAEDWATTRGVTVERHPADWDRHGRRAGILRNVAMLDTRPDRVVVFPGGRGTAHCAGEARARGLGVVDG